MASGNTLLDFEAPAAQFPASAYATPDVRNNHACLDFDATADEACYFEGILPTHYAGGGLTVILVWAATSATTGVVRWDVAIERHDTGTDLDADSFASDASVDGTVPGTSGAPVYTSLTFTSGAAMDSLAAGEHFRLRVNRDANHANDTATGDAELLAVHVKET